MARRAPYDRWRERVELPLTVAAVVFLVAYAVPILDAHLDHPLVRVLSVVSWVTWAAFGVDYLVRLYLVRRRWYFVRTHLLDLALVALPLWRPLRALRVVTLVSVINRRAGSSLRGRVATYVTAGTLGVLFVSALAVLDAERDAPKANITSFGDALWWAITTMTTVGYGDRYPVTFTGRLVAAGLMVCGVALLGIVTASFASWFIRRVAEDEAAVQQATLRDVDALREEVRDLQKEIHDLTAALRDHDRIPASR